MADALFEPEVKRSLVRLQKMYLGNSPSIALECKRTQEPRLSFDRISDGQIDGLLAFRRYGMAHKMVVSQGFGGGKRFTGGTPFDFVLVGRGESYVLVNFRFTKKAPRKDIAKGTNKCFAIPIEQYIATKEVFLSEGRASLPYEWFTKNAIECSRLREKNENGVAESMWDFESLVDLQGETK
jgi:hypothetical protein